MSTFDIQSIAPEGYEVEMYRRDMPVEIDGVITMSATLTLRKKWTPKVGEVIAVCDSVYTNWEFRQFQRFADGDALCETPDGHGYYWEQYRKLTPEERGE